MKARHQVASTSPSSSPSSCANNATNNVLIPTIGNNHHHMIGGSNNTCHHNNHNNHLRGGSNNSNENNTILNLGGISPPSLSSSPSNTINTAGIISINPYTGGNSVSDSPETENNLNKNATDIKGSYTDKRVLNICSDNYMLNLSSGANNPSSSSGSNSRSNSSTPNTSEQILFNVSSSPASSSNFSASDCRTGAFTCLCRPQSPQSSPSAGGIKNGSPPGGGGVGGMNCILGGGLGASNNSSNNSVISNNYNNHFGHNVSHQVSSLLPLIVCRACFHNVCASFSHTHACLRNPDTLPPPTLTKDVVST